MLGLALVLAACSGDQGDDEAGVTSALDGKQPIAYATELRGLDNLEEARALVQSSSRTFQLTERGAASAPSLLRRAENDISEMLRVLRSEGYYDAGITASVVPGAAGKLLVIFDAEQGRQYRLAAFQPTFDPKADLLPSAEQIAEAIDLEANAPARGSSIVTAEAAVVRFLKRRGFPDARFIDRKAIAEKNDATLTVTSRFDPGQFARFGALSISPDSSLDHDYILALVPWKPGDTWNQTKVDAFQADLKSSGLFANVSRRRNEDQATTADEARRDLVLDVENAKQRSIGGSLRYDTDQGPGVRLFWRHRNLFGEAEDFRVEADMLLEEQKLTAGITRPRHPDKRWTTNESITLRRLDDEAFEEQSITLRSGMELDGGTGWTFGGNVEGSAAVTETDFSSDTAYLVGLPLFAKRDRTDNPLDATNGYRFVVNAGPYVGLNNGELIQFGVTGAGGSVYVPLIGKNRLVLAMRTRVTSILSQNLDDIPVNQLLFAGGGASVRGFEFQSISPANNANDLTGGRFLNENSIELRLRLTETFGVVGFADAGLVEEEPFPSFKERLNVGVGGGFRYYSPVGPIRFDIAFPLARRQRDNLFEFYISLGQAF